LTEYLALADKFPQSENAAKSLYAAAWILENVKKDTVAAQKIYRRIIDEYPESDYQKPALESLNLSADSLEIFSPEKTYQEAERLILEENKVDSAQILFDLIIGMSPQSSYAAKSAYAKAWATEYLSNPGDSTVILAYQKVINDYPGTEYAEEARIKLGLSQRAQPVQAPPPQNPTPQPQIVDTTKAAAPDTSGPKIPKAPIPLIRGQFVYPETEILSNIKGTVVLKIRIDFDGSVNEAEVVNSLQNTWIDDAAKQAALKTKFDPDKIDISERGGYFLYTVEVSPPNIDHNLDQTQQQQPQIQH
jgi:TonB family protein